MEARDFKVLHISAHADRAPGPLALCSSGTRLHKKPSKEQQPSSIIDERRIRRKASNRESSPRSRMRKKKQIEELLSHVDQLLTMNHQLSEKVIRLQQSNHQILQENAELKDKVSSLHFVLNDTLTTLRRGRGQSEI